MVLPQVADRRQRAADVAVKGGVADGELSFLFGIRLKTTK